MERRTTISQLVTVADYVSDHGDDHGPYRGPIYVQSSNGNTEDYVVRRVMNSSSPHRRDGDGVSHCFYREYPRPGIHSGLPFVGEVFASHDKEHVFLAAEGRKFCQEKYDKAHDFHMNTTGGKKIQFRCIFETDGSVTMSDPVHRRMDVRFGAGFVLIKCPVPAHLKDLIPQSGARQTRLHLTLESMVDLATGKQFVESKPRIRHFPVCSHAWPSDLEQFRTAPSRKYKIALMTRIAVSYSRGRDHQQLSISQKDFVLWMEYHWALGIEHFYIYDDSNDPDKSTIRAWCEPYVKRGIVTYVNYPYDDIVCDKAPPGIDSLKGYAKLMGNKQMYVGQVISGNGALRRYENETEWMGHWDVDEFLTIDGVIGTQTLQRFLNDHGRNLDEIGFARPVYGPCKSNTTSQNISSLIPFEHKECLRHDRVPKGIYRTATVLHFRVHKSHVRMDNRLAIRRQLNIEEGHIAHFRVGDAAGKRFPRKSPLFFTPWIEPMKERLGCLGYGASQHDCSTLAKPVEVTLNRTYNNLEEHNVIIEARIRRRKELGKGTKKARNRKDVASSTREIQ